MKPDPKYMLGIEWEPHPSSDIDFDYWCDDDLEYLLNRYFPCFLDHQFFQQIL